MNFKNMKNKMDQGVFGEIHFTENEKYKILNTIYKKETVKTNNHLKDFISLAACFILIIGISYLTFGSQLKKSSMPSEQKASSTEATATKAVSSTQTVPEVSQLELAEAAKNFDEIETDVKGEDIFYYGMITMALQKLEFKGEENYLIPLSVQNIKRIQFDRANLQYLKNKAVELNASEPYRKIIDKWLKGDFSTIEIDYLAIRNIKSDPQQPNESPVLKVRTAEEEQKYIKHFFGNEGLQINERDWQ
jgi:hypothetical protein